MANKVKEILLVSTFYDAFIFEQDGRLSEQIYGEYRQLNLSTAPIITSVPTGEDALAILKEKKFDLVVTMLRIGKITPFDLAQRIKEENPELPVLLLLNMLSDVKLTNIREGKLKYFDDIFLWNGDTKLFLAMVKSVEDKRNLEFDTKNGLVRIVLFVEDSIQFYSILLPLLYEEIIKQTQLLIDEELTDINKRLLMRTRPKVILAHNYEEAMNIFTDYQEYILAVISDISFLHKGKIDSEAGIKLISKVKENEYDIPTILLSSEDKNYNKAAQLGSFFLHKKSKHLLLELRTFIKNNLGFGDFIFRDGSGREIERAHNLIELEEKLQTIPDESLVYHSKSNHFSSWLIARGETRIARQLRLVTVEDFETVAELRQHLITTFRTIRKARNTGKIISFSPQNLSENTLISKLSEGSLGGKGRGLAFLNALLVAMDFSKIFQNIRISLPTTAVIGTNEFDDFIIRNKINDLMLEEKSDAEIDQIFINGQLSEELTNKLKIFLDYIRYPLAVRSSGLLEDSYAQPFAGIYRTYMLPNNAANTLNRFEQLVTAVKLVFASIYIKSARNYIENLNHQVEEEKMAVIIQQLVGSPMGNDYFMPHFSGVAQSYNFYPITSLKNEDGIASVAIGMGKSVIEGGRSFQFCPRYPHLEFIQPQALVVNSQKKFLALNMKSSAHNLIKGEDVTISELSLSEAETFGILDQMASVWDMANERLIPGINIPGPRVITFENILKNETFPLADILDKLLEIGEKALGTPVEIEFAVNLTNKPQDDVFPTFYLLQIRPLAVESSGISIFDETPDRTKLFLYTEKGMGNGVIQNLFDIIYLDPEKFDNLKTLEMQAEIESLNEKMKHKNQQYILIGPGRWGSQDRFLGIPVKFIQVSNARVIVEVGLENFNIEPSQGTHFFHNIVAMKVGYFNIPYNSKTDFLDWDWLKKQTIVEKTNYFVHIKTDNELRVCMNGKTGVSVIFK
ncbi:MAG TPA: PEP/pyruvate-binding domain-containing protein [Candidatus Marinimicrobia bacterium]|nr:PEP/pyruvate-binding domain-containing protein [Candidatus Neomarinimicrobiota bacterium]